MVDLDPSAARWHHRGVRPTRRMGYWRGTLHAVAPPLASDGRGVKRLRRRDYPASLVLYPLVRDLATICDLTIDAGAMACLHAGGGFRHGDTES